MKTNQINESINELIQRYSQNNEEKLSKALTLSEQEHYEKHRNNLEGRSKIINTWTTIQNKNIEMRNSYANKLFWLLAFQLGVVDFLIILVGASYLKLSEGLIIATAIKGFIELVGFIYIIVNYLFKPIDSEMNKILEKLDDK